MKPTLLPNAADANPSKGQASRESILLAATRLVTIRGLDGLSIGDLAAHVGMSKSGLYAHFKSKEELELATIETATAIFDREVLQPALQARAGLGRLRELVQAFLSHLERRVFPGGCFFAAIAGELDTRPGPARDRVESVLNGWLSLLRQCILDAQSLGELNAQIDVTQLVFEVEAMLLAANFLFLMGNDPLPLSQAREGVENALSRCGASEESAKNRSRKKRPSRHGRA